MPLPDLIEIVPLAEPVGAEITVPGSKSITNRTLILAALAGGETKLEGALWSEDTQVMVEALQKLGFEVKVALDPEEFCNRTITVHGLGGRIPNGGTPEKLLELFVGNAGTAARFLSAFVCLGHGVCRLHGVPRMHERPQGALFQALRELGYVVECEGNKLPAVIHGAGPKPGACSVSIAESSQFASALLLCAEAGGWSVRVVGEDAEESSYVEMTRRLIQAFPKRGGTVQIEPDASSGSYFWAAGWLQPKSAFRQVNERSALVSSDGAKVRVDTRAEREFPSCRVRAWPTSGWQIDSRFPNFLPPPTTLSRQSDLGDSIMTAIVLAPFHAESVRFTDLGRLRLQECERVLALRTELTKCGAKVMETGDTLEVFPSALHGAEIETYHDHRLAMCFAILGLKVPGLRLKNPACVKKTFPNFFQKLAVPPPGGLGATILDAATRRPLSLGELFAE
ncbi:MAG: 3-phosphoshikimate 1-carboxyvinyltransferase [Verrucomicrobia bacterium]|nr:3-phosphoshikimate 1-carboxyvinyltransferase [Verrucomicrobiota bacterium]